MGADMVNLTTLRAEVAEVLTAAGFSVAEWTAATLPPPPCVIVSLDDPYVELAAGEESGSFGAPWLARIVVELITGRGPDEQVAAELDEMIGRALLALTSGSVPGDGLAQRIEVRAPIVDAELVIGAHLHITFPLKMKASWP